MMNYTPNKCLICSGECKDSKIKGLVECKACGFVTTNISMSEDELKTLYSEDYFHGKEYGDYLSDKKLIQKNLKRRLDVILQYMEKPQSKSLFEIGCAYGFFLELAQTCFEEIAGVDISEAAVQYARQRQLNVTSEDFLTHSFDKNYDVFCMWDTIEHLLEPQLFVEKISGNINRGGLVAISTGDIGSLNARLRGGNWRQIHPPTHLHYFNRVTLTKLLEKNGFEIVHISHPGVVMSMNNILYIIFVLKQKRPSLYKLFKKIGLTRPDIYWNLGDLIYIIGRKK